MTFSARLLWAIIAILVITVLGTMVAADRWLRASIERTLVGEMRREAQLLGAALLQDPADLAETARRLGALGNRRITIVDSTGQVLGDSEFDDASLALLDNHRTRPEIAAAFATGLGVATRYSTSTKRVELKVAIRRWPGVVRVSAPIDDLDALVADAQRGVFLAALAALAIGLVLAWFGGREVARPMGQLATAARALAAGQPATFPTTSIPEIRQLVHALRAMQEELAIRMTTLLERRQETTAIVESMVEGILAVDAAGTVVFGNPAVRRQLGYANGTALPNIRELFRTPDGRQVVDRVLDGEAVLGHEVAFDDRVTLVTARPLPKGGAVVCMHDITDLRRLETVRRDFVANVSHELKTPLTSIAGYADILATDDPDPETAARFIEVIRANAHRMQQLVDDLLDLATFESGVWRPAVQAVAPEEAAQAAWAPLAGRADAAGITFAAGANPGVTLHADPEALRQVLTNLYDNAVRHTPSGGQITVEVSAGDTGAVIAVSDTGTGIPADHLPRVFERFYRADPARSRSQGGTGLGLSIVKHLVEAHGGRVDITSAVGRGTTVRMVFPHPAA